MKPLYSGHLVLENSVRYREVSAIERSISVENLQLVPKIGVRYREVSAIKHVRYREVPLYMLIPSAMAEK